MFSRTSSRGTDRKSVAILVDTHGEMFSHLQSQFLRIKQSLATVLILIGPLPPSFDQAVSLISEIAYVWSELLVCTLCLIPCLVNSSPNKSQVFQNGQIHIIEIHTDCPDNPG